MKYTESTETSSSSTLSSSCSEGQINRVITQPKYKSSSLSSSCSDVNVINRVISESNHNNSLVSEKTKSSSEAPNSSEDDGSSSSVNTSNFKEEKKQLVNGKKSSQKEATCMLQARKDSVVLFKGLTEHEWPPEDTSADDTNSRAAASKGPSEKIKACLAKQANGGQLYVKEEGKGPVDKELYSNLLLQMWQERSLPPSMTMPASTTRGLGHEPTTLVKSNSVSATKADNILKLDYIPNSATSHNKLGHRLSTGDSPLYMQKRYGSQGPASLRTSFPSPGTPSRSSFSGVPTALMINNKTYMVGKFAVNEGTGKLLPLYNLPPSNDQEINPGRLSVGFSSRAGPPSKWDDAEKWLVNASPSHPSQLPPPHPSKQACYPNFTESRKVFPNNKKFINVLAASSPPSSHTPASYTHTAKETSMHSYQSRSLVPLASPSASDSQMQELAETMSDSELSNTQEECKVFVRSTSHNHSMKEGDSHGKHRHHKSQVARKSVLVNSSKDKELHVSSPVALQLERLKLGSTNAQREQLPKMHDVYAVECSDGAPCGNDDVAEGSGAVGLARLVVQAGKVVGRWGTGAMRDASTDVSPKLSMSRRDMGTQMTPVASSKTSRSATPLKSSSPVRHNTPTRAKQAATSAHSPATSKVADSSSAARHHLDLQNCHVEKLGNRHVTCHAGSDSSTTSFSTTSHETSSSSWKSLQENIASEAHLHNPKKDQTSSAQEALKIQDSSAALQYAAWGEAERCKHMTRYAREEARIDAWESHQKAKAEAEMKKLEMKLERLRAQATEKIMNKVATAHLRAEEMRASARAQQAEQLAKSLEKANSISRKGGGYFQESLGVCFSLLP